MKTLKTCKTGCGKMKSGGAVKKVKKMAQGGQMYGIPQTGTTNYSAPTMKKGGVAKGNSKGCPEGYYVEYTGGPCIKIPKTFDGPSVKVAGAILGSGIAALGTRIAKNVKENKPIRQANRAAKKAAKTTANDIANKKMGGSLKPVPSGNKGLAKLPTVVRNKMGYQKKGGSIKRK
jgi:hypothetical protein